jgi:trigger factor
MKHTRKELSNNKLEYQVEVAADDVARHHKAAVKKLSRDVKVSGFRKGHVPPEVAARHVDAGRLADESINAAINEAIVELIKLEQLQLLDRPEISITKFVPAQVLEFTAVMQIVPPVKLADFLKLKAKKANIEVDDNDVNEVVENLRKSSAEKKPVKRPAKNGDEVIIDFSGLIDGQEFAGGQANDYALVLGSNSFIPGFEKGIVGKKAGDKFDVLVKFPKDYAAKNLADKKATFKIVLKKVSQLELPKLDDKFAASVAADFKTVDDLRRDIKKELIDRAERETMQKFQDDLLNELADKSQVEVPEILVDDQLAALEQKFVENLAYRGLTLEKYLEQEKINRHQWVAKELRPTAEKRVRNGLVMAELARQWNITATDEEVAASQAGMVAKYNDPNLQQRFSTPEARRQIAQQIVADKTLQRLAQIAAK